MNGNKKSLLGVSTRELALCGMFAAMTCVLSPFSIPIPFSIVPISPVHIAILLASGLLGAKLAALSQIVFVLIGAAGVPVFSGFRGGLGHLLGPTGGFIIGYIFCAFISALLIKLFNRRILLMPLAMAAGMALIYIPGVFWYMHCLPDKTLGAAIYACVLLFLPGDAIKIAICTALLPKLYKQLIIKPAKQSETLT